MDYVPGNDAQFLEWADNIVHIRHHVRHKAESTSAYRRHERPEERLRGGACEGVEPQSRQSRCA